MKKNSKLIWYHCAYCGKKLFLIDKRDTEIEGIYIECRKCKQINHVVLHKPLTNKKSNDKLKVN